MCGRFILVQVGAAGVRFAAVAQFPSETNIDLRRVFETPRRNIAPTQQVLTVVNDRARRLLVPMRWGLVPSWAKDGDKLPLNINARDDRVASSGMWRGPLKRSRCLIPADGFYEWKGPKGQRVPYLVRMQSKELFAFAGLFDTWVHPETGEATRSAAVVTTSPNEVVKDIFDRMPVILPRESEDIWLDPDVTDAQVLVSLLKPYPAGPMEAFQVGAAVNDARNESPDLVAAAPPLL